MMQMTAAEAWAYLAANPNAQLVDVRTKVEWHFVGIANLDALDRQPVLIEWVGVDRHTQCRFYPTAWGSGFARYKPVDAMPVGRPIIGRW
jgi:rhodanese-related sulfurtransferase